MGKRLKVTLYLNGLSCLLLQFKSLPSGLFSSLHEHHAIFLKYYTYAASPTPHFYKFLNSYLLYVLLTLSVFI